MTTNENAASTDANDENPDPFEAGYRAELERRQFDLLRSSDSLLALRKRAVVVRDALVAISNVEVIDRPTYKVVNVEEVEMETHRLTVSDRALRAVAGVQRDSLGLLEDAITLIAGIDAAREETKKNAEHVAQVLKDSASK